MLWLLTYPLILPLTHSLTHAPYSLSLSLSRTHTHTHTQQFDRIIEKTLDDKDKSALGDETDGGGYNKSALPTEADYIVAYATLPGYVSWRNSEYGSWFIKALTDTMFEAAGKEHFLDILTEVNRRVAEEFQSKGRNKQMPGPVTMLTRKLYFRPESYK